MTTGQMITLGLAVWVVASVPLALFVGAFIAVGTAPWEREHGHW